MQHTPEEAEAVRINRQAAQSPGTRRTLAEGWGRWEEWARAHGTPALPANLNDLEAFLAVELPDRRGYAPSTVRLTAWAVSAMHRLAGLPEPGRTEQIRRALAGVQRRKARPPRRVRPLTIAQLARVPFPGTLQGVRDKALLLLAFAGALRKSEAVALDVGDVEAAGGGLTLHIRKSKTDQTAAGASVYVAPSERFPECCPVRALEAWLGAAGHTNGALFRGLRGGRLGGRLHRLTVDRIVRAAAARGGLGAGFGGHSMRAGCATWLSACGVSLADIARHGRWKSLDTVLVYCRGDIAAALRGAY